MSTSTSEIQHPPSEEVESTTSQKVEELLLFKCFNGACELEFPVFPKDSVHIVYCPRCSGMVVKNVGSLKISVLSH